MTNDMGTWAADMATAMTSLFPAWETLVTAGVAVGLGIRFLPRIMKRFS